LSLGDLPKRAASALLLAVGGLSALALSEWTRYAFLALALSLGAWEFARMLKERWPADSYQALVPWAAFLTVVVLTLPHSPWGDTLPDNFAYQACAVLLPLWTLFGYRYVSIENLAPWFAGNFFALTYIGIWGASLFELFPSGGIGWASIGVFTTVLICIVAADSGAYFSGRAWGRRKLCPTLSAKKTWEGFWGGSALTVVVGVFAGHAWAGLEFWQGALLGILLAITSVCGDLFISSFKRFTGVKDCSQIIPGHGGILDRFDSVLFSAPPALLLLRFFH
jgi:phosphatidate cytidylyltransferase